MKVSTNTAKFIKEYSVAPFGAAPTDAPTHAPLVDVVFSFDSTGSMRDVLESVRTNLTSTIDWLFKEVEGLRVGLIIHGDYADFPSMFWLLQPTKDIDVLKAFIKFGPSTSGGDYDECYELVLQAALEMKWLSEVKVLVVIGDAMPHEAGYTYCEFENDLDWKEQVKLLKAEQITVFSCHAEPQKNEPSVSFYYEIAKQTGGYYFPLEELDKFKDYMVAICLKATDGAENVKLLQARNAELEVLIARTTDETEKNKWKEESVRVSGGLTSAKKNGVFSRETSIAAEHLHGISRAQSFAAEMKSTQPGFFVSRAASDFMDIITDSPALVAPPPPPPIGLLHHHPVDPVDDLCECARSGFGPPLKRAIAVDEFSVFRERKIIKKSVNVTAFTDLEKSIELFFKSQ